MPPCLSATPSTSLHCAKSEKSESLESSVFGVSFDSVAGRNVNAASRIDVRSGTDMAELSMDGEVVGVGEGETVGVALGMSTPLFQTSFLPLFTHVYFLPAYVAVEPDLEQVAPAFGAAKAVAGISNAIASEIATNRFFMAEVCCQKGINTTI